MGVPVQTDCLHCVEVESAGGDADGLAELLAGLGLAAAVWCDAEGERTVARVYCDSSAAADGVLARVTAELDAWQTVLSTRPVVHRARVTREDWAEAWKQHFRPLRVSRRLVIKPTWEAWVSAPDDVVVEIDPGMSFGTGRHGTTQGCLEYIDELADRLGPVPLLDLGCGSGILAMAAVRLGFRPVVAIDNDPAAAAVARANLERTGFGEVAVRTADLAEFAVPAPFAVVVANILAPVLVQHAGRVVGLCGTGDTNRGGHLVLSGILDRQYADVRDAYLALGCREESRRVLGEWVTGCLVLG